jgi:hypothetical protein
MKSLLKYLPYLLAAALFFVGRWTGPDVDNSLLKKYEVERKYHLDEINKRNEQISHLSKQWFKLRQYMIEDSIRYANELKANNEAYLKLKKKYNEINLNRATVHQLDSIVAKLYP